MTTAEEKIKKKMQDDGVSIANWAISNGFNPASVYAVLSGRKCIRGQSHLIAVRLGLKPRPNKDG